MSGKSFYNVEQLTKFPRVRFNTFTPSLVRIIPRSKLKQELFRFRLAYPDAKVLEV